MKINVILLIGLLSASGVPPSFCFSLKDQVLPEKPRWRFKPASEEATIFSDSYLKGVQLSKLALQEINRAKTALILGNPGRAKSLLERMLLKNRKYPEVQKRLLALAEFVSGNYQTSQEILAQEELASINSFRNVCLLQVLNHLILNDLQIDNLVTKWGACKSVNGNHLWEVGWMDFLVFDEGTRKKGLATKWNVDRVVLSNVSDEVARGLQMKLYQNDVQRTQEQLFRMNEDVLGDPLVRDLLALHFRRASNEDELTSLFEGELDKNAKGAQADTLFEKDRAKAISTYEELLQRDQFSLNALERVFYHYLAKGNWEQALIHASQLTNQEEWRTRTWESRLILAFLLMKNGKYEKAKEQLRSAASYGARSLPWEFNSLLGILSFQENLFRPFQLSEAILFARESCEQQYSNLCSLLLLGRSEVALDLQFSKDSKQRPYPAADFWAPAEVKGSGSKTVWEEDVWLSQRTLQQLENNESLSI